MDEILTKTIWRIREKIEANANVPVNLIYTGGNTYQLYFATKGCRFACTMCNYGFDFPINVPAAIEELDQILSTLPNNVRILVLEASGSFLDEAEIPKELRRIVMRKVAQIPTIQIVDIETHYTTVTLAKIEEISEIFKDSGKEVEFEFGVESTNESVLKIYNKYMNLENLKKVIWQAHSFGIGSDLNFLTGAPLLSIKEQIEDTLHSIKWTIENCPSTSVCVLFPLNIKHNTLVELMYHHSRYELISHWEFIEMLSRIPHEFLDRISIAWWGNRFNIYDGVAEIMYPQDCSTCHSALQEFYNEFYSNCEISSRIALLRKVNSLDCECKKAFLKKLETENQPSETIEERFENLKKWLLEQNL